MSVAYDLVAGTCTHASTLGLQMGYFLQKAERDYIIIEKESVAGIIRFRVV